MVTAKADLLATTAMEEDTGQLREARYVLVSTISNAVFVSRTYSQGRTQQWRLHQ